MLGRRPSGDSCDRRLVMALLLVYVVASAYVLFTLPSREPLPAALTGASSSVRVLPWCRTTQRAARGTILEADTAATETARLATRGDHGSGIEALPDDCGCTPAELGVCRAGSAKFTLHADMGRDDASWTVSLSGGRLLSPESGTGRRAAVTVAPGPFGWNEVAKNVAITWTDASGAKVERVVSYVPRRAITILAETEGVNRLPNLANIPDDGDAPLILFLERKRDGSADKMLQRGIENVARNIAPRMVIPYDVSQLFEFPKGFDSSHPEDLPWPVTRKKMGWGYRFMCTLWFRHVWTLPGVSDVEWLLRLDTDSEIHSRWSENPFETVAKHGAYYMANRINGEPDFAVTMLRETAANYTLDHKIEPANPELWQWTQQAEYKIFYNNFQVAWVPFFKQPKVLQWMDTVVSSHEILRRRWGDAPLLTVTCAMFMEPKRVIYRPTNTMPYSHDGWTRR